MMAYLVMMAVRLKKASGLFVSCVKYNIIAYSKPQVS